MLHNTAGRGPQAFETCRYDGSRLLFRGPRRRFDGDFIACLGGTETFGKCVAFPWPDLLEEMTGVTCVNFGWPNAGVDAFAGDRALLDCAARARLCVLQVPGATNMSNRFYSVHPRRNDRFLRATSELRALFPDVDFCEFSFTRHMLGTLQARSPDRFAILRQELAATWIAGMRALIGRIGVPVVLLWLSGRAPDTAADRPDIWADPALVDGAMLSALRTHAQGIVDMQPDAASRCADTRPHGAERTRCLACAAPGPAAHRRIARQLRSAVVAALEA